MTWKIVTTDSLDTWLSEQQEAHRATILAALLVLRARGPHLTRLWADTVYGSRYANMKALRVQSKGDAFRLFFAFDPQRCGILLCAGCKSSHDKRFYDVMIPIADREYRLHLTSLKKKE
mgnify:FL=1